jgi:hypothetical protein
MNCNDFVFPTSERSNIGGIFMQVLLTFDLSEVGREVNEPILPIFDLSEVVLIAFQPIIRMNNNF